MCWAVLGFVHFLASSKSCHNSLWKTTQNISSSDASKDWSVDETKARPPNESNCTRHLPRHPVLPVGPVRSKKNFTSDCVSICFNGHMSLYLSNISYDHITVSNCRVLKSGSVHFALLFPHVKWFPVLAPVLICATFTCNHHPAVTCQKEVNQSYHLDRTPHHPSLVPGGRLNLPQNRPPDHQ